MGALAKELHSVLCCPAENAKRQASSWWRCADRRRTPLQGRYSFVGAQPSLEVVAKGSDVVITRHPPGNAPADVTKQELTDPLQVAM